ncbi:hypothetical protein KDK_28940 [Dictyobacter kobayashii]|uniref:YtkA-like domain-containing protein n=2 Tax=Dictyobacter kobayashii TaxID=2014872 RepID=A0A402AJ58_9CHLR|nr:hypothetical protein KDK_28940 [Dictyobacter kobayashii]
MFGFVFPGTLYRFKPGTGDRTRVLAAIIPRFALIALASVVILGITGIIEAIVQLKAFEQLWTSSYGQALLLKLGLFIILLGLGIYYQLRVGPRMSSYAVGIDEQTGAGSPDADKLQRSSQTLLRVEAVLAILLLVSVGILTSLSPTPIVASPISRAAVYQGTVSGLKYTVTIDPARPGQNSIDIVLKDHYGQPLRETDTVTLSANMLEMDMGLQKMVLKPVKNSPGHYRTTSTALSMAGNWELTLLIQHAGTKDIKKTFTIALGY